MKKELPKIFKKDVSSSHDNNKKVYYAGLQDDKKKEYRSVDTPISQDSLNSVETEIRKLFKSNSSKSKNKISFITKRKYFI